MMEDTILVVGRREEGIREKLCEGKRVAVAITRAEQDTSGSISVAPCLFKKRITMS